MNEFVKNQMFGEPFLRLPFVFSFLSFSHAESAMCLFLCGRCGRGMLPPFTVSSGRMRCDPIRLCCDPWPLF